jgi:hypothetical protein
MHMDLRDTQFDEETRLPDDTKWTPDADMSRFTDPKHPEFWRSDFLFSPAYRGADDPTDPGYKEHIYYWRKSKE